MPAGFPVYLSIWNQGQSDARRLWRRVLGGDRGVMVHSSNSAELAGALAPFGGGLVKLLSALTPVRPRIAIHYSQRSIQAD